MIEDIVKKALHGTMAAALALSISCAGPSANPSSKIYYAADSEAYWEECFKKGSSERYRQEWLKDKDNMFLKVLYANAIAKSEEGYSKESALLKEEASVRLKQMIKEKKPIWKKIIKNGDYSQAEQAWLSYRAVVDLYTGNAVDLSIYYHKHGRSLSYSEGKKLSDSFGKEYRELESLRTRVDQKKER